MNYKHGLYCDKKAHCIDCGKIIYFQTFLYGKKRCQSCAQKGRNNPMHGKIGSNCPNFKDRLSHLPSCSVCGKKLSGEDHITCTEHKNIRGENSHSWKGGKPKCIGCGKRLKSYKAKRCKSCETKYRHEQGLLLIKSKPNKPEKIIKKILHKLFKNRYEFVGNGKFWIKNKIYRFNPDFIDLKNKKIIEFYGDYWHNLPMAIIKDKIRLETYKNNGFDVLILREHQLKNINIIDIIKDFNNG